VVPGAAGCPESSGGKRFRPNRNDEKFSEDPPVGGVSPQGNPSPDGERNVALALEHRPVDRRRPSIGARRRDVRIGRRSLCAKNLPAELQQPAVEFIAFPPRSASAAVGATWSCPRGGPLDREVRMLASLRMHSAATPCGVRNLLLAVRV
jgi:hypothetical protein